MVQMSASHYDTQREIFPDVEVSEIDIAGVRALSSHYGFSSKVTVYAVKHHPYHLSLSNWVCFFEAPFQLGLRFPLPRFVREVLHFFSFCPAMMLSVG